jgi:hypothetical protein
MSTKIKFIFALFILLGVVYLLCACDSGDPFSYCQKPFTAIAEGQIDGMPMQAKIYCDPTIHNTKEVYTQINVTYLSPASLRGVTVSFTSDGNSHIRLNDMEMNVQSVEGLTEIFQLICPTSPPTSLQYNGEKLQAEFSSEQGSYTICFEDRGKYPSLIKGNLGKRNFEISLSEYISNEIKD